MNVAWPYIRRARRCRRRVLVTMRPLFLFPFLFLFLFPFPFPLPFAFPFDTVRRVCLLCGLLCVLPIQEMVVRMCMAYGLGYCMRCHIRVWVVRCIGLAIRVCLKDATRVRVSVVGRLELNCWST